MKYLEEANRKLDICRECEFYKGLLCSKCGCVMKVKVLLPGDTCPLGKHKNNS